MQCPGQLTCDCSIPNAIPPDLSNAVNSMAVNVSTTNPAINRVLSLLDAYRADVFANIPGLAAQYKQIQDSEIGPYKQARTLSAAPQIRLTLRLQTGLPQSIYTLVYWLVNPTLYLRTLVAQFRTEFVTQEYLNFVFIDPPFDPQFEAPFILSRKLLSQSADTRNACLEDGICLADDVQFTAAMNGEKSQPVQARATLLSTPPRLTRLPRRPAAAPLSSAAFPNAAGEVSCCSRPDNHNADRLLQSAIDCRWPQSVRGCRPPCCARRASNPAAL